MTKGFRVTTLGAREHLVEPTDWPIHPRSLVRLSRLIRRRRRGYHNPLPPGVAYQYRRRFVRNHRRRR